MEEEIPQWALERAAELADKEAGGNRFSADYVADLYLGQAFAHYIARHEEPPVDPLLEEARKFAAEHYKRLKCFNQARRCLEGKCDQNSQIKTILAALRRGIELGKEQSK